MKKRNLTEMVFILDRSGSMHGLEADTIGGFNSMIEKQKKEEGEALASSCGKYSQIRPAGGRTGTYGLCDHYRRNGECQPPLP